MSVLKNLYCRLCAELKRSDKLLDLQKDSKRYDETVVRLEYLNAQYVNILGEKSLPTTICYICYDSLNNAYEFLNKVKQAQTVLSGIFTSNVNENFKYQCTLSNEDKNDVFDDFVSSDIENDNKNDFKVEVNLQVSKIEVPTSLEIKHEPKEEGDSDGDAELEFEQSIQCPELNVGEILNTAISNIQDDITPSNLMWYAKELPSLTDIRTWKSYNWICLHCEMEFPDVHILRLHSKEFHHKCYGFSCVDCTTENKDFDTFIEHVRLHRKHLRSRCQYCDAPMEKSTSNHHIALHFQKSQIPCRSCGEIFKDEDALQKHTLQYNSHKQTRKPRRKRGEPVTVDDLTCKTCLKVYKNRNSLRDHQKVHIKDRKRNYTCERCGKAFFSKGTLTSHIMMHDKNRPHICKICNKSFLFPNMLRRHVEMHSGVKPFSCEQCGRCFRLKYQLNAHKIIHTDQMPYMCQFCSKSFRFKQILKNHERQHTGAKPYSCDLCRMEFTNWSNYNKHMKRRHGTDTAKKKITPDGVFPVNPETGQIIEIEDPVATEEWKSKIMIPGKRGKKKKVASDAKS